MLKKDIEFAQGDTYYKIIAAIKSKVRNIPKIFENANPEAVDLLQVIDNYNLLF